MTPQPCPPPSERTMREDPNLTFPLQLHCNQRKFYCLRQCTSKRGRQSANQSLSQQVGSQTDTHSLGFFCSGRCGPKQQGCPLPQSK